MTIEDAGPGRIRTDCLDCGAMFELDDFRASEFAGTIGRMLERGRRCPACEKRFQAKREAEELHRYREARRARLDDMMEYRQTQARGQGMAKLRPCGRDSGENGRVLSASCCMLADQT